MKESAAAVAAKHGFSDQEMQVYIAGIIRNFQLPGAHYRVQDVARSPLRKLAPSDRLVGPARYCEEHGLANDHLVSGIALAIMYAEPTDPQSVQLQESIARDGLSVALEHASGIPAGSDLSQRICQRTDELDLELVATTGKEA